MKTGAHAEHAHKELMRMVMVHIMQFLTHMEHARKEFNIYDNFKVPKRAKKICKNSYWQ